jgi:hypothetical protein
VANFSLPIDSAKVRFQAMTEPSLQTDFDTGAPKVNKAGQPVFALKVLAQVEGGNAEVLTLKVSGEPRGIRLNAPLRVVNLQVVPWTMENRSGISYRADSIESEVASK